MFTRQAGYPELLIEEILRNVSSTCAPPQKNARNPHNLPCMLSLKYTCINHIDNVWLKKTNQIAHFLSETTIHGLLFLQRKGMEEVILHFGYAATYSGAPVKPFCLRGNIGDYLGILAHMLQDQFLSFPSKKQVNEPFWPLW